MDLSQMKESFYYKCLSYAGILISILKMYFDDLHQLVS